MRGFLRRTSAEGLDEKETYVMSQTQLRYSDRPSWLNQTGSFSSILILLLMPFLVREMTPVLSAGNVLIAVLIMLTIVYSHYSWEFTIGDGDIQSRHGIFSKETKSIRIRNIRDIRLKQTTIQRIFGVGDVEFTTGGSIASRVTFCGIASPETLRDRVESARKRRKRR